MSDKGLERVRAGIDIRKEIISSQALEKALRKKNGLKVSKIDSPVEWGVIEDAKTGKVQKKSKNFRK